MNTVTWDLVYGNFLNIKIIVITSYKFPLLKDWSLFMAEMQAVVKVVRWLNMLGGTGKKIFDKNSPKYPK